MKKPFGIIFILWVISWFMVSCDKSSGDSPFEGEWLPESGFHDDNAYKKGNGKIIFSDNTVSYCDVADGKIYKGSCEYEGLTATMTFKKGSSAYTYSACMDEKDPDCFTLAHGICFGGFCPAVVVSYRRIK